MSIKYTEHSMKNELQILEDMGWEIQPKATGIVIHKQNIWMSISYRDVEVCTESDGITKGVILTKEELSVLNTIFSHPARTLRDTVRSMNTFTEIINFVKETCDDVDISYNGRKNPLVLGNVFIKEKVNEEDSGSIYNPFFELGMKSDNNCLVLIIFMPNGDYLITQQTVILSTKTSEALYKISEYIKSNRNKIINTH